MTFGYVLCKKRSEQELNSIMYMHFHMYYLFYLYSGPLDLGQLPLFYR